MKKILVTGATGFIGNYVVEKLLQLGYPVIATSAHKTKAIEYNWFTKVVYIECDLNNVDDNINYFVFFNKPDALIHLAWQGLPDYSESFHVRNNLPVHFTFLNNLISNGLKDITVAGTCLEYGLIEGCLRENMDTNPAIPYAIAKNELREKLQKLPVRSFSLKWIRLFYMYGKGQNPNALFSQLDKALENGDPVFNMSGGEQVRDFLPVEKVADYITRIALQDTLTGIINCCSGKPITIKEQVKNYLNERDKHIHLNLGYYPYTTYEPMNFWGDNSKLKSILSND